MASAPILGSNHHFHSHSHSYSGGAHLSPGKTASHSYANSNGNTSKPAGGAAANSPLFTHAESSRETSPVFFPTADHSPYKPSPSFEQNVQAFQQHGRLSHHRHSHSSPAMRSSRPRGESDLGRAADGKSEVYRSSLESIPNASPSWFSLPEALTSMLVTFPFLLSSASYSLTFGPTTRPFPPLGAYSLPHSPPPDPFDVSSLEIHSPWCAYVNAGILTSGTLLAVGIVGKIRSAEQALENGKTRSKLSLDLRPLVSPNALRAMALRILSVCLPFYASMVLGGSRTALVMLIAVAADLICSDRAAGSTTGQLRDLWASKVATSVVILVCFISDELSLTIIASLTDLILGYLALAVSILTLPPPLPSSTQASPSKAVRRIPSSTWASAVWPGTTSVRPPPSRLIGSPMDIDMTLFSGFVSVLFTALASSLTSTSLTISPWSVAFLALSIATMAAAILTSQPSTLRNQHKAGLALGCLLTASCSFLFSPSLWPGTVCNGALAALAFVGVLYDSDERRSGKTSHDAHDHVHNTNTHHHRPGGESSAFSRFILAQCEPGSLVHTILNDRDSRRIAYFTVLNFGFMLVQAAYGYLSGSLGLLSDTVHMLFDCLGLIVGLGAAVASKWPTSPEKPYGWSKLNTLAGFGNGIFLMLVSVEFVWEAIEGIVEGRELRHVEELLVVSTLGLLVNLVGLFAFGHAHAGHDHGHGHGHSHSHHSHSHSHEKSHGHSHPNGQALSHECSHGDHQESHSSHSGHHHHHEHNENMHGIFLHVAADAGGSLAVIFSTALTLWKPWYLWDPLATILIAILIFAAAVPLVTSSGQKLLLVVPDELEYGIKEALQELAELRGVVSYAVPRFWIDDKDDAAGGRGGRKVVGAVHVIAATSADLDDVRERVEAFMAERNMNVTIHVEREQDGECWCRPNVSVVHSG